jgi:hypothetical protein
MITPPLSINMNRSVRVKLTDHGRAQHWEFFLRNYRHGFDYIKPKTDEEGWSKFKLWELMRIFGPSFYEGMVDLPFEENRMEILDEWFDEPLARATKATTELQA